MGRKGGNYFGGLFLGLIASVAIGLVGSYIGYSFSGMETSDYMANLGNLASGYPAMNTHFYWLNVSDWTLGQIVMLVSVLAGPFIGGFLGQIPWRRSRLFMSLSLSILYTLVFSAGKCWQSNFDFGAMETSNHQFLVSNFDMAKQLQPWAGNLAVTGYFLIAGLVLFFIGSLFISKKD